MDERIRERTGWAPDSQTRVGDAIIVQNIRESNYEDIA